ncbi:SDR family NAD(P)-dependent oxidoreductase [Streptomyces sp. MMS24-I29]|uniref:SDR family NAD(P)-dependent oxidoreductase n=1 Tax=Streptomyces sp. MMS24-I29 TaxID=3351480 RepID=UPI003C7D1F32
MSRRTAFVTGAAGGIGGATACRLAAEGFDLVLADRAKASAVEASVREFGGGARCVVLDVQDAAHVTCTLAELDRRVGGVDAVVCSHGIGGRIAPFAEFTDEEFREVVSVNLIGVGNVLRAAAAVMAPRGSGRIVTVSSVAGKEGNPGSVAYSASKAGVIGMTKSLARELGPKGVLINCVTPGATDTPLVRGHGGQNVSYVVDRTPLGRMAQPEEVAAAIAWLVSEDCTFTSGAVLDVSGGRASY